MARPSIETARGWVARPVRDRLPSRGRKGPRARLLIVRGRARGGPRARPLAMRGRPRGAPLARGRKGLWVRPLAMPGRARTGPRARGRGWGRGGIVLLVGVPRAALRSMPKVPSLSMPKVPSLSMPRTPSLSMPKAPSLRRRAPSRRRRRARGMAGNLGMAAGACAGYVLGTRAGRERYQQIVEQARQLWERPQVQDLAAKGRDRLGTGVERAAGSAGERLQQVRERSTSDHSNGGPARAG